MLNTGGLDNSLFVPQQPISGDDTGFMATMGAIANPTGVLEQKQNAQIAKSIADIQMSSIYPELQNKFLEQRTQYISDYKDALRSHRGMGRLRLNPQEELQFQNRRKDMGEMVNWAKVATSSLDKVTERAMPLLRARMPGDLRLSAGDYKAWQDQYFDKVKRAKTGADVPAAVMDFENWIAKYADVVPQTEQQTMAIERGQRAVRKGIMDIVINGEKDYLNGLNKEHYAKDPLAALKERTDQMFVTDQAKADWVANLKDADRLPKDIGVEDGLRMWEKTRVNAKQTTKSIPSFWIPGSPSAPTTFTFDGKSEISLAAQSVPIKGNFDGKDVDGTVYSTGIDSDGNKYIKVLQDKVIPVTRGANKGKMVSSGEKETVTIPVTQSVEQELKKTDKVNIDYSGAVKPQKQAEPSQRVNIKDVRSAHPEYNKLSTKDLIKAYKDQFNIDLY